MIRQHRLHLLVIFTIACVGRAASLPAAPPSVTYFEPAGVQHGQTVTVTAGGTFSSWPVRLWSDRQDLTLECEATKGKIKVTAAADAAPGPAWVRLLSDEGASSPRPLLIGTLPEMNEVEPNDELAKANEVSGPTVVNGRLAKAGDVDGFAVLLERGQTLVATAQAKRVLGSPMDCVLQIVNGEGFVLAQNDEGYGLDPLLVYTAEADGKVFVRLFAFPEVPTSSISFAGGDNFVYRLTLTTAALADAALPLALQAGQTTQVRLAGWNVPAALSSLPVTAPATGLVASIGHAELGNAITLPLTNYRSIVEERAAAEQPQAIDVPVVVSGRIAEPNERDVYRFAANKGDEFTIAVAAHELGYPLDPHVEVLASDGKVVAQNDDGDRQTRNAELSLTAPQEGEYRVVVRDLYRLGGPRHFYRLTITRALPDYALSVAADSFVLPAGKPLEIPVTVNRKNGHGEEIEVSVTGLPTQITATTAKSAAKGDSSKSVKLVLKYDSAAQLSGPIRIVGKAAGEETSRTATATVAGAAIEDVWLTAAAKK